MKGGLNLKELKDFTELLIYIFNVISRYLKKASDNLKEVTVAFSQSRKLNIIVFAFLIISILLYRIIAYLLPSLGVAIFYIIVCLIFQYINVLKFITIILNVLSLVFKHSAIFFKIMNVFLFAVFVLFSSVIFSLFISILISYKFFNNLIADSNFIWWLFITILISIAVMSLIAYGCSIYIIQNYEKNYEQIIITFILDFITGTLFTLVVGLKEILASSLSTLLISNLGKKFISEIENIIGINTSSLIITVLYWIFSLIFCFQIIYRTAKKVKQNNVSL